MEDALSQISTWCDTADPSDMGYFAYILREYFLARAREAQGADVEIAEAIMAEMLEYLE